MNFKRVFLLYLILLSVSLARPFSVELSLSGGFQHLSTDDGLFSNGHQDIFPESSVNTFLFTSLKPEASFLYKNTGIYVRADKPIGDYRFDRYWILSGGLKQRINLTEKTSLDLSLGITWHSVDEAIHSFMESFTYIRYVSLPGFDIGLSYQYQLFKQVSLYFMANYNYNIYEVHTFMTYNPQYYFQAFSLNAGVMFSLL